jgi:RsiW-degrading membrane proteinase PrsW (M82 family)
MNIVYMYAAALLPAIILLVYIYRKDPNKEPLSAMLKAVLWGIAICIPVASVEFMINSYLFGPNMEPTTLFGTTAKAFLVAAMPEEAAKLLVLWIVLRKNPYFDEHFDGIVYAVCVGLGFAAVENIFYVVGQPDWQSIAISRALLAVPGHYAFAIMMGYYYSVNHFIEPSVRNALKIFFVPFMAHGIYDALAMSGSVNPLVGGISFLGLIYFCVKMQKHAQSRVLELSIRH